LEEH
jgi:hypothetical protein